MAYSKGGHNEALRAALLEEQHGYCAYTERRIDELHDTVAVEHFQPRSQGGSDEVDNLYATLQSANQRKRRKEKDYKKGHPLFCDRFFQEPGGFESRIEYLEGDFFYAAREGDDELGKALIDYLAFNDPEYVEARRNHVQRLCGLFADAGWDRERQRRYLLEHPADAHYPSVLRAELGIDVVPHPSE